MHDPTYKYRLKRSIIVLMMTQEKRCSQAVSHFCYYSRPIWELGNYPDSRCSLYSPMKTLQADDC